ncbi:MAG: MlaE family ABC transporter permease [Alphaproteobacteria bacterium]|nr:MAG: ABC transporter permease [Rickettsiaceae bacterium 4572_127]
MEKILHSLGKFTLAVFETVGRFMSFLFLITKASFTPPFYPKLILKQFFRVGFYSLPVVGLTAIFSGMVLALQTYSGFGDLSSEGIVSMVVAVSMVREMGPVFAGLMVAGRVGAAMAAELGTMRVSEQIDALKTLAVRPFHYLIAPRVIATVLMLPLLTLVADIIGVFGGFLISTESLGFNPALYLQKTFQSLETIDVVSGLVKGLVFGFFISALGCYHGYYSKGGAEGVGKATTLAVVSGSVVVLLMNYFITEMFFGV